MKCIVHICGPQASGKTTLTGILINVLKSKGLRVASLTMYPLGGLNYVLCSLLLNCILMNIRRSLSKKFTKFIKEHHIHPLDVLLSERFVNIAGKLLPLVITFECFYIAFKMLITRIMLTVRKHDVVIIDEGVLNVLATYYHLSYKMRKFGLYTSDDNHLSLSSVISLYLRALKSSFKGFKLFILLLMPNLSIVVRQRAKRGDILPLRVIKRDYYVFKVVADKNTRVITSYLDSITYNLMSVSKREVLKILLGVLSLQASYGKVVTV